MPQIHPEEELKTFESLLQKTEWGVYSKFTFMTLFASEMFLSLAFLATFFAIPLAICDQALTKHDFIFIFCSLTIGQSVFGFILNCACDIYGRKKIMTFGLLMVYVATFMAAFSTSALTLTIMAFFLGAGVEVVRNMNRIFLAELMTIKRRASFLVLLDLGWSLGHLILAVTCVLIKETQGIGSHESDVYIRVRLSSWRIIFAVAGGLNLILSCCLALLEESPRFMLYRKKTHLALLILKQYYTINKSTYSETFQLREDDVKEIIHDYGLNLDEAPNWEISKELKNFFKRIFKSLKMIFEKNYIQTTLILLVLKFSSILGLHQMSFFFFHNLELDSSSPNKIVNGSNVLFFDMPANLTQVCTLKTNLIGTYKYFLLLNCYIIVGEMILLPLINYLGRNTLMSINCFLCGFCFNFLFIYQTNFAVKLLVAPIFIFYTIFHNLIPIICIESYPTAVRATALGLINALSTFPMVFLAIFLHTESYKLFLTVMITCFIAYGFSWLFKDLRNKPMME